MTSSVRLLTILQWADERSLGSPCAACDRWLSESPDATRQWAQVTDVLRSLDEGRSPAGIEQLSAEQVAEFLEGSLDEGGVREVEKACWKSPAQMAEVASAARFQRMTASSNGFATLHHRLLDLAAPPRNGAVSTLPADETVAAVGIEVVLATPRAARRARHLSQSSWPLVAAAVALAAGVIGGLLWLTSTRPAPAPRDGSMAQELRPVQPLPKPIVEHPLTKRPLPPNPLPQSPASSQTVESPLEGTTPLPQSPPAPIVDRPMRNQPPPEAIAPLPQPPSPLPLPQPRLVELVVDSATGVLLLDDSGNEIWRVGQGRGLVSTAVKVASLAESFTTLKVPELGTLVFAGSAEATLSRQPDRSWLVRLDQGRLAVRDLPAGRRVHVESGGTTWTAEGLEDSTSIALLQGATATRAFVPYGRATLGGEEVSQDQLARWSGGVMQPLEPLILSRGAHAARAIDSGLDGRWIEPPDDNARREWKTLYGRLVERLAEAEDAAAALDELFANSRDLRQAALLTRWRLAAAPPLRQPQLAWEALNDRREGVRQAAVSYLLELPEGDARTLNLGRLLRVQLGDLATDRMVQWLAVTRDFQPLTAPLALEMGDSLASGDLAVRQIAVSLLEVHTRPLLNRARLKPPDYDAAAPAAKRANAQREWSQILRRIFASRGALNVRGAQPAPP